MSREKIKATLAMHQAAKLNEELRAPLKQGAETTKKIMGNQPELKLFGSLNLDNIKKAFTELPNKVNEYKGAKQLKIQGAQWGDKGVSLSIYNPNTNESIKLGNLIVSRVDDSKKEDNNFELDF